LVIITNDLSDKNTGLIITLIIAVFVCNTFLRKQRWENAQ